MDLAHELTNVTDLEAALVTHYPALQRRLTVVLRDADAAQDIAQAAMAER